MQETGVVDEHEQALRKVFHYGNRLMLLNWRLGAGSFLNRRWPFGQIMVITHTGRRSGRRYRTPVNYARHDGSVYATAGFGEETDWYRNLMATPDAELWLPSTRIGGPVAWWRVRASTVTDPAENLARLRDVMVASGFAGALDGFRASMPDAELEPWTLKYPVIRFELIEPLTGDGGPSDLAAWPANIAPVVAAVALARRRRR